MKIKHFILVLIIPLVLLTPIYSLSIFNPDNVYWKDQYLYKDYLITSSGSILCPSSCEYMVKDCSDSFRISRSFNYIMVYKEISLKSLLDSCEIETKEPYPLILEGNISNDILYVCNPKDFDVSLEGVPIHLQQKEGYVVLEGYYFKIENHVVRINLDGYLFSKSCRSWKIKLIRNPSFLDEIKAKTSVILPIVSPFIGIIKLFFSIYKDVSTGHVTLNTIYNILALFFIFSIVYIFFWLYSKFRMLILDFFILVRIILKILEKLFRWLFRRKMEK